MSLRGRLLISSPALVDPNFRRTVVLVTHHDDEGAMGLVLTRPSEVRVADAVPELAGIPGADGVVRIGGPVQPEAIMALAEFEDADEALAPVVGSVGFVAADASVDELSIRRVRVFAGYSGWAAGQLEAELDEPSWIVADATADDAFVDDPDELWRRVLERKGGKFALIAAMPFDPRLN
ncbi:MAG: YqgE/AlgH family protein [Actinobacteria bacterium]|nr:YqgE/AlgH family protein [Actinomycetota bacterium]MBV8396967.1 YqgE/AlgH family protein [Actinomycetota bacterium]MBV8597313.1 YqgE/AlgH family protein [Actinomycetota bacterium]